MHISEKMKQFLKSKKDFIRGLDLYEKKEKLRDLYSIFRKEEGLSDSEITYGLYRTACRNVFEFWLPERPGKEFYRVEVQGGLFLME